MLSVGKMGLNADYYLNLSQEDYYTQAFEPKGKWFGEGAEILGLAGDVEREALGNLLQGSSPDGERQLVQFGANRRHQTGWDLTFSAPKAVSVLWALSDETTRSTIERCHEQAVHTALRNVQSRCLLTRRGKGGRVKEPSKLVAALFEHGSSRALDPQVHTHCLVLNIAVRNDGTTGTIESSPIYLHKMVLGALYRTELAASLQRDLGVKPERDRKSFTLEGMPKAILTKFSKRGTEIRSKLEPGHSAAKAAVVTIQTRSTKTPVKREELFEKWRLEASGAGWTPETVTRDFRNHGYTETQLKRSIQESFNSLKESKPYVTERDLLTRAASQSPPGSTTAEGLCAGVSRFLNSDRVSLQSRDRGPNRFVDSAGVKLSDKAKEGLDRARSSRPPSKTKRSRPTNINHADRDGELLRQAIRGRSGIVLIEGLSVEDRNVALKNITRHFEKEGVVTLGITGSRKRAEALSKSSIDARTAGRFLWDVEKEPLSLKVLTSHDFSSVGRALAYAEAVRDTKLKLGKSHVIVLDGTDGLSPEKASRIIEHANRSGAGLIILGEPHQSALRESLREHLGSNAVKVPDAAAKDDQHRETSTLKASIHRPTKGVPPEDEAMRVYDRTEKGEKAAVIITRTAAEADAVNERLHEQRSGRENGEPFSTGDRVRFSQGSRLEGIEAGSLGTVMRFESGRLSVKLDSGRTALATGSLAESAKLGYAQTIEDYNPKVEHRTAIFAFDVQMADATKVRQGLANVKEAHFITSNPRAEATARTLVEMSGHNVAPPSMPPPAQSIGVNR